MTRRQLSSIFFMRYRECVTWSLTLPPSLSMSFISLCYRYSMVLRVVAETHHTSQLSLIIVIILIIYPLSLTLGSDCKPSGDQQFCCLDFFLCVIVCSFCVFCMTNVDWRSVLCLRFIEAAHLLTLHEKKKVGTYKLKTLQIEYVAGQ